MDLLKVFRVIARTEGVSYLLILGVTWPIKLLGISKIPNLVVGMSHGVLFIAYVILLFPIKKKLNWSFKEFILAGIASLLPFGTFYMEKKMLP